MDKLKPCPFCGSRQIVTCSGENKYGEEFWYSKCTRCQATGPFEWNAAGDNTWNTRTTDTSAELVEALEAAAASLENLAQWIATGLPSDYKEISERVGFDADKAHEALARHKERKP